MGWLAVGERRGVQLHGRHRAPVLHGRPGTGDRGAGGHLGARVVAGQGSRWRRVSCLRRCRRRPESGRSFCWTARRTGCLRCAGSCWPGRWWRRRCSPSARTGRAGPPPYWPPGQSFSQRARRAAYTVETVAIAHNGPMTTSGPAKDLGFGGHGGGPGGPQADNPALAELVQGLDNRWAAASVGSFTVSSLELKTGASIMAIGGFTGGDDSPTLAQFQAYVANHDVRYFIAGERFGPPGHRGGSAGEITAWVRAELHTHPRRRRHRLRPERAHTGRREAIALILTRGAPPSCCYRRVVCHRARHSAPLWMIAEIRCGDRPRATGTAAVADRHPGLGHDLSK